MRNLKAISPLPWQPEKNPKWLEKMNESQGTMSDDIISQLQQATTDEQKTWVITEVILKTLPAKLSNAVRVAAIPHWFDIPVLAALLSIDATEAEYLYQGIKALSFSEPFGNLGYALHDLTRASILLNLVSTQPDDFQDLSQRAYEYFCQFVDAQNTVEAIYHLLATDKTGGMEKLVLRGFLWNWPLKMCFGLPSRLGAGKTFIMNQ